jgi:hypothetical protein
LITSSTSPFFDHDEIGSGVEVALRHLDRFRGVEWLFGKLLAQFGEHLEARARPALDRGSAVARSGVDQVFAHFDALESQFRDALHELRYLSLNCGHFKRNPARKRIDVCRFV